MDDLDLALLRAKEGGVLVVHAEPHAEVLHLQQVVAVLVAGNGRVRMMVVHLRCLLYTSRGV